MTRLASLLVAVVAVAVVGLGGCSKPSEADCRKALANMQRLMGTDNLRDDGRIEGDVRRCKGGSKKKAVACAIKATTLDELRACEFFHVPINFTPPNVGSGSGAVVPPTGSGAAGSAAGSAAAGSGSAAGSAAAGSAAGPGSASGSAAPGGSAASPGASAGSAATSAGSAVGSAK